MPLLQWLLLDCMPISPKTFQRLLLTWFDQHGRKDLPWQQNKSPYSVWISEIMLQQTQVATVIPYFHAFMKRFPTCAALARATEDEVLHHWAGLGYYSRARCLHRAAKMIMTAFNGIFPNQFDDLIKLPGIGASTANAILSIAFGKQAAIMDGNVKRVFARLFAIESPINVKQTEQQLWAIAERYMPAARAADYTQAIMDLGATHCVRRHPPCQQCALSKHCLAYKQDKVASLPMKKASRPLPVRAATFLIYKRGDKVLLLKRPSRGIWGGLWSFPERPPALHDKARILPSFRHTFTHYHLDIHPVLINARRTPDLPVESEYQWYSLAEPVTIGIPKPVQLLLEQLRKEYVAFR